MSSLGEGCCVFVSQAFETPQVLVAHDGDVWIVVGEQRLIGLVEFALKPEFELDQLDWSLGSLHGMTSMNPAGTISRVLMSTMVTVDRVRQNRSSSVVI